MNYKNVKFFKIIFLFITLLFFCELFLEYGKESFAEYSLDKILDKKNNNPKVKLEAENIRYPTNFNSDIGDFVTLKVFGSGEPGNGVIIASNQDFYYLITAGHVVGNLSEEIELRIQTIDGKKHNGKLLMKSEKFDSALLRFESKNYYYPAHISSEVFAYKGLAVELVGYSLPSKAVNKMSLRKTFGTVTGVLEDNTDGYNVLYSNPTNIGMSGSGVFSYPLDGAGIAGHPNDHPCFGFMTPTLIAIHGRGEEYFSGGKSGVNLGMSIHDLLNEFKSLLLKEGVFSLPRETDTRIWKDGCPVFKDEFERFSEKERNRKF